MKRMMKTESVLGSNHLNKEVIQWGCNHLISLGYTLKSHLPEKVQDTPWSYVARFETTNGYIYLKHTPDLFALEPKIIQILSDKFNASVPIVLGHNLELNCFLMKDGGSTLREVLERNFDEALVFRAIDQFTSLQLAVAGRVDILLNMGVPDYRLDKLSDLYEKLISQEHLLIAEGLSEIEIQVLESQRPRISGLCKKLSDYPVKQSIVQSDFNNNNILLDDTSQKITMIDLGEIVIAYPFFSLFNYLYKIQKYYGLTDKDDRYLRIKHACFKNYINLFESKDHFEEAFVTAQLLYIVYRISDQYRFMIACGKENLMSFQHWKLGHVLKEFIATCI
jgi:hypothetical protein